MLSSESASHGGMRPSTFVQGKVKILTLIGEIVKVFASGLYQSASFLNK